MSYKRCTTKLSKWITMCGLVGFFNTQTPIKNPKEIITKMTARLVHRGPDDSGIWTNDTLALGHQRLAILDLTSAGHQPMSSSRYVIAYNGEIYNTHQLKKNLATNYPFQGHSDTEVILALLELYGFEHAIQQLTGMFAFAVWDKQEKILRLTRDRIGEKPLYYGLIDQTLIFASELKALLAFPNFPNKIDPESVSALMQYGYIPSPRSIYQNIYKLPAGTHITFANSAGLPEPKRYWSTLQIAEQGVRSPLLLSDQEAIQQLDAKLNHIIRDQMVADVPIGAFLSGGIDSSVIAAIMQANSSQSIQTFTIGFDEKNYNEAHFAKAIAKHLNTDHTELYIHADDALEVVTELPKIYDEPFADSSAIPTYLVSKLTRQHVKIALSGDGGDELFGGYNRYLWGPVIWNKLRFVPYLLRMQIQKILALSIKHQKLQKLASILTADSKGALYQKLISQWQNPNAILQEPFTPIQILSSLQTLNFIEQMMITDTLTYLPDDIMVKIDRAGMAVSLENRAPFLDHQLIEWMWSLPMELKIRNRKTKWLLRQVVAKYIPETLIERPKMGFGIPLGNWLRGPLKDWASQLLTKEQLEEHGFFKTDVIMKTWQEHLSGKYNWQYQLWTVLMFQAWVSEPRPSGSVQL